MAIVLGDFAHNARGGLDHAVWEVADPEVRDRDTGFPVVAKEEKWESIAARTLRAVSDNHVQAIRDVQPYHQRNASDFEPLAVLQKISNDDKHRAVYPVLHIAESFAPRGGPRDGWVQIKVESVMVKDGSHLLTVTTEKATARLPIIMTLKASVGLSGLVPDEVVPLDACVTEVVGEVERVLTILSS